MNHHTDTTDELANVFNNQDWYPSLEGPIKDNTDEGE